MNRRIIKANDNAFNSQYQYADNYIKTSKYSLLTFLPLNLFEQFRRLANTYFLCLLILQLIPQISSLTPITTAVPLIVVLFITGLKDAHDDICRHQSDNQVNNRLSQLLKDGHLVREPWHKVKVGDIIRIENDQFVAVSMHTNCLSTSIPAIKAGFHRKTWLTNNSNYQLRLTWWFYPAVNRMVCALSRPLSLTGE